MLKKHLLNIFFTADWMATIWVLNLLFTLSKKKSNSFYVTIFMVKKIPYQVKNNVYFHSQNIPIFVFSVKLKLFFFLTPNCVPNIYPVFIFIFFQMLMLGKLFDREAQEIFLFYKPFNITLLTFFWIHPHICILISDF